MTDEPRPCCMSRGFALHRTGYSVCVAARPVGNLPHRPAYRLRTRRRWAARSLFRDLRAEDTHSRPPKMDVRAENLDRHRDT